MDAITLALLIACACGPVLGAFFFVIYRVMRACWRHGWLVTLAWPQEEQR